MKLLSKEIQNGFEPFELRILVESEEDLIELWHRFNFGSISITDRYKSSFKKWELIDNERAHHIWKFLDKKIKERNIKP